MHVEGIVFHQSTYTNIIYMVDLIIEFKIYNISGDVWNNVGYKIFYMLVYVISRTILKNSNHRVILKYGFIINAANKKNI